MPQRAKTILRSFRKKGGGTSSERYMDFGTASEIVEKYGCDDAKLWAKAKLKGINDSLKLEKDSVMVSYNPNKKVEIGNCRSVHCGHLLLLPLYNKLGLAKFSAQVKARHRFKYDFADILCKLVMCRILFPDSKRATRECLNDFIDAPDFSLDDIYNFLGTLSKEITPLQRSIYEATKNELSRRTGVIYYDCTNYYFEIEKEDNLRRYGKSKEHRPNPIVRITKTEFDARPVYLRREDRIRSHFAICFVALLLLKAFQRQVNEGRDETDHYSTEQIIEALSGMDYNLARGVGYVPAYSATLLRLKCCEVAQIPIDRQILMTRKMNKIIKLLRNVAKS